MRREIILFLDDAERFLRLPVARRQAERPVFNLQAATKPIVGVTEHNRAGQSVAERAFDLPRQKFALVRLAFTDRVHAKFAEDEWLGVCERLQPREVGVVRLGVVKINMKEDEIRILRLEKFRRRIRCERAKTM